jgi:hypothetical protein
VFVKFYSDFIKLCHQNNSNCKMENDMLILQTIAPAIIIQVSTSEHFWFRVVICIMHFLKKIKISKNYNTIIYTLFLRLKHMQTCIILYPVYDRIPSSWYSECLKVEKYLH